MSQKNDEWTGVAIVFGFIAALAYLVLVFVAALAAFASFVLTILCLFAWNEPLRLGKLTIEPEGARAFVWRGVAGAVLVPAFVLFCSVFFGEPVDWKAAFHYMLAVGYVGGSIGFEVLFAEDESEKTGAPVIHVPTIEHRPSAPERLPAPPRPEPQPFRYATWDDEEAGR
jgi:hypothetical protein